MRKSVFGLLVLCVCFSGCATTRYHIPFTMQTPEEVFRHSDEDLIDELPRIESPLFEEEIARDPFLEAEQEI